MFLDDQNFEKLGEDIWVYHNFLSEEEINSIIISLSSEEEGFWKDKNGNDGLYTANGVAEASVIPKRIEDMLEGEFFIHRHCGITKMPVGHSQGAHFDSFEFLKIRELEKSLTDGDCFVLVEDNVYGMVVYLNDDYDGGEIYYTKQDIVYKPRSGDFLVHSAEKHCEHGVRSVKSGIRYTYPSSIRRKIKNPC